MKKVVVHTQSARLTLELGNLPDLDPKMLRLLLRHEIRPLLGGFLNQLMTAIYSGPAGPVMAQLMSDAALKANKKIEAILISMIDEEEKALTHLSSYFEMAERGQKEEALATFLTSLGISDE